MKLQSRLLALLLHDNGGLAIPEHPERYTLQFFEGGDLMKRVLFVVALCVFALVFGCMQRTRVADFTVLASKNISTLQDAKNMGVFEGKDCRSAFLGQLPNQKEALDRALEAGKGNAMVDAVIYFKPAQCIFDDSCWEVKGTVIKTKDMLIGKNINKELETNYIKQMITSSGGNQYIGYKKKSAVDLDNDAKQYDLIIRVE